MKKPILSLFAILMLCACSRKISCPFGNNADFSKPEIDNTINSLSIDGQSWKVETVSTPASLEQGLSNRSDLPAKSGMLFVFNELTERTFWMKNMKFPLDLVFIKDDKILKIDIGAQPEGDNPQKYYYSNGAVNRVLEINAGEARTYNLKTGDKIKFND